MKKYRHYFCWVSNGRLLPFNFFFFFFKNREIVRSSANILTVGSSRVESGPKVIKQKSNKKSTAISAGLGNSDAVVRYRLAAAFIPIDWLRRHVIKPDIDSIENLIQFNPGFYRVTNSQCNHNWAFFFYYFLFDLKLKYFDLINQNSDQKLTFWNFDLKIEKKMTNFDLNKQHFDRLGLFWTSDMKNWPILN